ncbi:vasodilator-stimulated phosphoprotein-like [Anoplophora glabripennis]|uniref:vasodilator-stimulated phosphoprotein-like n=1 Tax=Anoplophora glabripennis TaxID=217634 RepID=UPI000874D5CD|nr:vasodilator-stimulated phosphoprotein-like [Anoplophora glabripennis]
MAEEPDPTAPSEPAEEAAPDPTPTPPPEPAASPTPTPPPEPAASPTPTPPPEPAGTPTPTPPPAATGTPTPIPPSPTATTSKGTPDPLHAEFLYYTAVLRVLGPTITSESDRKTITPWIRKLFRPEYHSSKLRGKRNRYLAFLSTSLLLDEAVGVFRSIPPDGAIPDLKSLHTAPVPAADWEIDTTWQDTLVGLPDDFKMLECSVHATSAECKADKNLDKILDQEFQLYLYIAKPYAYLLKNGNDRTRVASWLQMLCSIHGKESCSSMKAIRNDYMMALLGYLQDLRSVGPFAELPSWKTLVPLAEAAKAAAENKPITDPTGIEANEFLTNQPMPDDGAFCYIALTGEMVTSHLLQD